MKNNTLTILFGLFSLASTAQSQQFTTVGTSTFTVPPSVIAIKVEAIGGGGGGGRVRGSSARESGGGGGGAYASGILNVIPANTYTIGVGNPGVQNDNIAAHGGNSYFGDASSTNDSITVFAEGGKTIILPDGSQEAGAPGGKAVNSVGNRSKFNGGDGGTTNDNDYGGGGGGAAGTNGNGGTGGQGTAGIGTSLYGGSGGQGGVNGGDDDGIEGYNYGGGGGGARKSFSGSTVNRYGSAGAQGIVIVSWSTISGFSPLSVCSNSNQHISINGTNLTATDSVLINGVSVPFTVVSDTEVTILSITGASSGNIFVYTAHGCAKSEDLLTISNNSVTLSLQGATLSSNYTGNSANATYQWIDCVNGNAPINGATGTSYTAAQNSLYAVQITENGCTVTSDCFLVATVGINDLSSTNAWKIFPNPAQNEVMISHKSIIPTCISILDLTGKKIQTHIPQLPETVFQLSDLKSGLYFVEITVGNERYSEKLLVKQ